MLISGATSVLHGGAQQDVPSHPAVTTPSEMTRCNTKAARLEVGICSGRRDSGDASVSRRIVSDYSYLLVQLACAETVLQSD